MNDGYSDGYLKGLDDGGKGNKETYYSEDTFLYNEGYADGYLWGTRCRIAEQHKAILAQNVIKEKP